MRGFLLPRSFLIAFAGATTLFSVEAYGQAFSSNEPPKFVSDEGKRSAASGQAEAEAAFAEARRLLGSQPDQARSSLLRATMAAPSWPPPWYALGMLERRQGRHREAIAAYQRYIALAPHDPEPLYGLGVSQQALGQTSEARATLSRFVKEASDPALAGFVERARTLLVSLQPPAVPAASAAPAASATPATSAAPTAAPLPASPLMTARARRAEGRLAEALPFYRQATAAQPTDATVALEAGEAFLAAAQFAEARSHLSSAARLAPANAVALYDLAVVERQLLHDAEAVRAFEAYIVLRPQDPDAYYGMAAALAASGDRPRAAEALRRYLRLENRASEARWVARAQRRLEALEGKSSVRN